MMLTQEKLVEKLDELKKNEIIFIDFLKEIYNDKKLQKKINKHLWRIRKEIEIIEEVLDSDILPF